MARLINARTLTFALFCSCHGDWATHVGFNL